ncbi:hypothetical protein D3C75_1162300 [compost metagenome]
MLRYFTLFSFYRPGDIVQGSADVARVSFWLVLTGLLAFAAGIQLFRRRDLPL